MSALRFAFRGPVTAIDAGARAALFDRATDCDAQLRGRVSEMIAEVRRDGDAALRAYAARFDGATLDALEVPRAECAAALDRLDPELRRVMERAAANIRDVHSAFRPSARETTTVDSRASACTPRVDARPTRARC
jgi:histidinol dehydrogenase